VRKPLAWIVGLAFVTIAPSLMPNTYVQYVVNTSLILAFATIGLNIVFGYAGQHAFGFPVFFGVGAYVAAILAVNAGWPPILSIPCAAIGAGLVSMIVGFSAFRLRGIYFGVATIAFAYVIYIIAENWVDVTHGPMGIPQIPPLKVLANTSWLGKDAQVRTLVVVILGVVIWVLQRLLDSPLGRAWSAIRENEALASSLGISPLLYQMSALVLGAAIAGLGGGLYAHYIGFISPTELGFYYIGVLFIMLIAGGTGTLAGPVIGSVVFGVLPELLRVAEMARNIMLGVILLVCVILLPEGLVGIVRHAAPMLRRKKVLPGQPDLAATSRASDLPDAQAILSNVNSRGGTPERLELTGVVKRFEGLAALVDVGFAIGSGEIVGLIGPNGAGKTTLFNIIAGTLAPTSGRVVYGGRDIGGCAPHVIAALGIARTYQITSLFPELSVADNVRTATHLWSCRNPLAAIFRTRHFRSAEDEACKSVNSILQVVGLWSQRDTMATALSYGDQRRLEVALALATGARLILLDEPAAGLNATETAELCALVRRLKAAGLSVVVIEHDMHMVMNLCDRIIVLNYGKKIFDGAPQLAVSNTEVIEAYLGASASHA
jgi:branched-chain amino acid transport system permease protein